MPLKLKFGISIHPTDPNALILTDATGFYHATENPGGYGTLNPARNTLFLLPFGWKLSSPDVLTPIAFLPSNGFTFTSVQAVTTGDALYKFAVLPISIQTPSDLTVNNLWYDTDAVKFLAAGGELVDAVTLTSYEAIEPYVESWVDYAFYIPVIREEADRQLYDSQRAPKESQHRLYQEWLVSERGIAAAANAFTYGDYFRSQAMVEKLQNHTHTCSRSC